MRVRVFRSKQHPEVHFVIPNDEESLLQSIKDKSAWNEHSGVTVLMDGKVIYQIK
jgi:hypothetical protein